MDSFEPGYDRFASGPLWDPKVLLILIGLAVALAVVGAAIGWTLSQNDAHRRDREALENHWKAIWQRGYWAAAAPGASVLHQAELLAQEIKRRLGPVAVFGGPLAKMLKELEGAAPPPTAPAAGGATQSANASSGPGGASTASNSNAGADAHAQATAHNGPTTINIHTAAPGSGGGASGGAGRDPRDAARLAIGRFNDWWSQKEARISEMAAARDALLRNDPPASAAHTPGGGSPKAH